MRAAGTAVTGAAVGLMLVLATPVAAQAPAPPPGNPFEAFAGGLAALFGGRPGENQHARVAPTTAAAPGIDQGRTGSIAPAEPAKPGLRVVRVKNRNVLVDPTTGRIVQILD